MSQSAMKPIPLSWRTTWESQRLQVCTVEDAYVLFSSVAVERNSSARAQWAQKTNKQTNKQTQKSSNEMVILWV